MKRDDLTKRAFVGFVGDRIPKEGGGAPVHVCDPPMFVPLDPRHDIRNHSPDGFQWGYGGSGPAQLALALCANVVGDERAKRVYQTFKAQVVAEFGDSWELERSEALQIIEAIEAEMKEQGR